MSGNVFKEEKLTEPHIGHPQAAFAQVAVSESRGDGCLARERHGGGGRGGGMRESAEQQLLLGDRDIALAVAGQTAERAARAELFHAVKTCYWRTATATQTQL